MEFGFYFRNALIYIIMFLKEIYHFVTAKPPKFEMQMKPTNVICVKIAKFENQGMIKIFFVF